jgi:hypothetical protein
MIKWITNHDQDILKILPMSANIIVDLKMNTEKIIGGKITSSSSRLI